MNNLCFFQDRPMDCIAMGRAGVDLYARERDTALAAVSGFDKFVGGSPANIAAGLSKLGARVGFIGKVSDDPLGRYVVDYLQSINIDTSRIVFDASGSKTGLAFTEMKAEDCALVMYRNNASDLLITPQEVSEDYIRQAKALVISGTALCRSPSRDAVFLALMYARKHGTVVIFDVDYRPYSWGSPEEVSIYYSLAAEKCDVIIGTREELDAMEHATDPGNADDAASARRWFEHNARIVVIKHGKEGSYAYTREGEVFRGGIFPVELVKPFGAGDAFASAFSHGLLQGHDVTACLEAGAASASIVISRDSCTEAMPSVQEIEDFIASHNR